ncbi:MAG: SCP2 sterol-binding domain-containing protein [Oscillospiraceae bacterium]|nr:SCP2 sterol-binding domain-containing protein [Oscillospiraceae bacterium]
MADTKKAKKVLESDSVSTESETKTGGVTPKAAVASETPAVTVETVAGGTPAKRGGRRTNKTKETAAKTGRKSKETATKTGRKTKETAAKTGRKSKEADAKAGRKTKEAVAKTGRKTKEVAAKTARKSKSVAVADTEAVVKKSDNAKKAVVGTSRKKKDEAVDKTDVVKTVLWNGIGKAKAKKIKDELAIQVFADGLDSFYVAIKGGQPEIERYYYNNNNGQLVTTEAELLKIAKGKYDVVAAVKSGKLNYDGNLSALLKLVDLF